jgi:hypothetical protein
MSKIERPAPKFRASITGEHYKNFAVGNQARSLHRRRGLQEAIGIDIDL